MTFIQIDGEASDEVLNDLRKLPSIISADRIVC